MKEIKAIIRPERLDEISQALRNMPGFPGMTVTEVKGRSAPIRHQPQNIDEELLDYSPKIRIDIVAEDDHARTLYETIRQLGSTRHIGDGIVWMTHVEAFDYIWHPGD
ncbi:P-II family nitrogen regulator [uncultured Oxalicibacterium sp.]|uniref:P-II family nitrogen regulator n=1 Tax=uncultured Oxalicibacterium sp. TaxID=1168540 RepID=UPI0025D01BC5|nr:P-II family nitrogen regulator [uncultured Oxalicibacterium sp.]